jgi:hypothetical protein
MSSEVKGRAVDSIMVSQAWPEIKLREVDRAAAEAAAVQGTPFVGSGTTRKSTTTSRDEGG